MREDKSNTTKWILAGILVFCLASYFPVFTNGFTNWDDPEQVLQNADVHALSIDNSLKIFSSFYVGMYQPFTTQVYAFIYYLFGDSATAFHSFSLLIHLINVILVFVLIRQFSRRDDLALITSALFALTPLQVESVAWVSASSNLLFTAFYLAGLLAYLHYIRQSKTKYFLYTLLFFILSLLSKPTAVSFPLVLLFMDFYFRRGLTLRVIIEKAPFFLLSLLIGLVIIFAREEAGHIIDISDRFGVGSRFFMVIYALAFYIAKLFVPSGLSAFHPYPPEFLPLAYYIAPLIPLMIIFLIIRLKGEPRRQLTTGMIFFLLTIFIVLEIIPVGVQVVKERYVYLPSIGIYYAFAYMFMFYAAGRRYHRWLPATGVVVFALAFGITTFSRTMTWHDSLSLWDDVLEQYPDASPAFINRGNAWLAEGDYNRAISDYTMAINWEPMAADAYLNRGLVYYRLEEIEKSIRDFDKAVALGINDAETYNNRGLLRAARNEIEGALSDFDMATKIDPAYTKAWVNKGLTHAKMGDYNLAITAISEALKKEPQLARAYYWRGMVLLQMGQTESACRDMKTAVSYGWPSGQIPEICL